MKNSKLVILLLLLFIAEKSFAQVGVSEAPGFSPDPKALLDISGTNKGLLIPRMTTAQRLGISPIPEGLTVYDNETKSFWYFDGLNWKELKSNASTTAYYPAVTICCQSWMTKNLDVDTYRNGDPIPEVTDPTDWAALATGAWCYYENDPANGPIYGKLYNWYAVNDPRGLAPEGWHVPTYIEWTTMSTCLGGDNVAGGVMKEVGAVHWTSGSGTNLSGFTGLPAGYRTDSFTYIGLSGYWWATSEVGAAAYYRSLSYQNNTLSNFNFAQNAGFSVRCIRD